MPSEYDRRDVLVMRVLASFLTILSPVVFNYIRKDKTEFLETSIKRTFNFNAFVLVVFIAVFFFSSIFFGQNNFLLVIILIINVAIEIFAAIKGHEGEDFRYPFGTDEIIKF